MTIKEYMALYGDIFKFTNQQQLNGIFTDEHKVAINNMLKYSYGPKEMVFTDPIDVDKLVSATLFDNRYKYQNSKNLVTYELPSDYTVNNTETHTKTNTGTQGVSESGTKTNTGTQGVTETASKVNSGTQVVAGTEAIDNTGTQTTKDTGTTSLVGEVKVASTVTSTDDANTVTTSQIGFDGGALVANNKVDNGIKKNTNVVASDTDTSQTNTNDLTSLRTDALSTDVASSETRTDNLTEALTGSTSRTDNLTEGMTHTQTRTDNLSESASDTHKINDVEQRYNLLKDLRVNSGNIRVSEVCTDLVLVLCTRDWYMENDLYEY